MTWEHPVCACYFWWSSGSAEAVIASSDYFSLAPSQDCREDGINKINLWRKWHAWPPLASFLGVLRSVLSEWLDLTKPWRVRTQTQTIPAAPHRDSPFSHAGLYSVGYHVPPLQNIGFNPNSIYKTIEKFGRCDVDYMWEPTGNRFRTMDSGKQDMWHCKWYYLITVLLYIGRISLFNAIYLKIWS